MINADGGTAAVLKQHRTSSNTCCLVQYRVILVIREIRLRYADFDYLLYKNGK